MLQDLGVWKISVSSKVTGYLGYLSQGYLSPCKIETLIVNRCFARSTCWKFVWGRAQVSCVFVQNSTCLLTVSSDIFHNLFICTMWTIPMFGETFISRCTSFRQVSTSWDGINLIWAVLFFSNCPFWDILYWSGIIRQTFYRRNLWWWRRCY